MSTWIIVSVLGVVAAGAVVVALVACVRGYQPHGGIVPPPCPVRPGSSKLPAAGVLDYDLPPAPRYMSLKDLPQRIGWVAFGPGTERGSPELQAITEDAVRAVFSRDGAGPFWPERPAPRGSVAAYIERIDAAVQGALHAVARRAARPSVRPTSLHEEELAASGPIAVALTVEVGANQPVVIDKLFGPAVYSLVRVTAVYPEDHVDEGDPAGEWHWLIEQDVQDDARGLTSHWHEVARFPAVHGDDRGEPDGGATA